MWRFVLVAVFLTPFALRPTASSQAESQRADVTDLTRLACEAGQAYARRDMASLERLTAEDYVQTDVRGAQLDRSAWLVFVKDRKSELTIECDDVQVRVYGDGAVVTGRWKYSLSRDGGRLPTVTRWTSFWSRYPDGWKRHAFQNTYVNPDADRCALAAGAQTR